MKILHRFSLAPLLLALYLPMSVSAESALHFKDIWVAEAPPMAKVMAGYFVVDNSGDRELLIEKVSSPQFKTVEMHRTVTVDGVARMVWQPHIHVPPGKPTVLKPGGKHLMLIRPKKRYRAGDKITLHLHLSDQTQQTLTATVQRR